MWRFVAMVGLLIGAGTTVVAAEPDLSTPQAAIKTLTAAVAAQDAEAVEAAMYTGDDAERGLARAFAELLVAGRKLNDAARAKFGTEGNAVGSPAAASDALAGLDKAGVVINGDVATLAPPALPSRTIRLKRSPGGKWQLVVRDFANAGDTDMTAQADVLRKVAGVFSDVAAQVEANKFGGPVDAQAAIQSRLAGVLITASRAAAVKAERAATQRAPATTQSGGK